MLVIWVLAWARSGKLESNLPLVFLVEFGVVDGGVFDVNIKGSNSERVFVGLCTKKDMKSVWDPAYEYGSVCSDASGYIAKYNKTVNVSEERKVELKVTEKGVVQPVFVMCDNKTTSLSIDSYFVNGSTYLDWRYAWVRLVWLVEFGVMALMLGAFTVMLCTKRAIYMRFHAYLIATMAVIVAWIPLQFFELIQLGNAPITPSLTVPKVAMDILAHIMIFTMLVLCGSGWGIHTVHFPKFSFVVTVCAATAYEGISLLESNYEMHKMYLVAYATHVVMLTIIAKMIVNELRGCERYLLSYRLIVNSVGYNDMNTPVRLRSLMQYVFLITSSGYIGALMVWINIVMYFDVPPIVDTCFSEGLNTLLLLLIIATYSTNKFTREDWMETFNSEHFNNCAIEEFNQEAFAHEKTVKWQPGTHLPLPPMMADLDYTIRPESGGDYREEPLIESVTL